MLNSVARPESGTKQTTRTKTIPFENIGSIAYVWANTEANAVLSESHGKRIASLQSKTTPP